MTLLLKQLYSFFKLLNSDNGTNQLATGLTLGIFLGFAPFLSLQTFLILLIVFIFRVQLGAAFISAFFFKFIAYLFDGPSHLLGKVILESELLRPTFVSMYNMPLVPMTRFNNSIVMGSFAVSLILAPAAFFFFHSVVTKYRKHVVDRIKHTKFWKALSASKIYDWYSKYDNLYGS